MTQEPILVVDDEREASSRVARALRLAGYPVVELGDGREALAHAIARPPRLVLAGVLVPGMSGYQLCRALRAAPVTRRVPIVLMSRRTEPADHYWAEQVGATRLIAKPSMVAQVVAAVDSILDNTILNRSE